MNAGRLNFSAAAFWSFALSFVLLPVGLGGDRPIPLGLAQVGLAFSGICLVLSPSLIDNVPIYKRLRFSAYCLGAALLWAVVQILPIVPTGWTHPLWQSASDVLGKTLRGSISIVPEDAVKGLARLVTYISAGVLAYVFGQDARRSHQLINSFWITGTIICFYGLIIQMTGLQQILWFRKWAYFNDLTATFVNHNHFAIYAGMVLIAGMILMVQSWRSTIRNCRPGRRIETIRNWILIQGVPRATTLVLTLLCIILSHSRAGLVCSLIGLGGALFFYQIYFHSKGRAVLVSIFFALVLMGTVGVAAQFTDRFAILFSDDSALQRTKVYDITWRAIKDNPWLGYGLNGFEPEYRLYQQNMYWEFNHAHSDLLESVLDFGLIGAVLLWSSMGLLLSGLWRGICRRRRDGMYAIMGLSASLVVLAHAIIDFDLQIPGIAMTWAVLMGVGLAQSWSESERAES